MELYFWCPEGYTRWLASSQAPQLYLYHLSLSSAGCAHAGLCTLRTEWALQSVRVSWGHAPTDSHLLVT